MVSRYDFMSESETKDEVTGSYYPDPLSINYLDFQMSTLPSKDKMTDSKIMFFWKEAYKKYGKCELDDIVLTLNGVEHKNLLLSGDMIYFPDESDIRRSFSK